MAKKATIEGALHTYFMTWTGTTDGNKRAMYSGERDIVAPTPEMATDILRAQLAEAYPRDTIVIHEPEEFE